MIFFFEIITKKHKPTKNHLEKNVYGSKACNHGKILPHSFRWKSSSYLVKQLKTIQYIATKNENI